MNLSDQPPFPSESGPSPVQPEPAPLRRRRVTRRSQIPTDPEGQAALIAALAKRAYPSVELFVLALVCGAVLGLGYLLDSQPVLLLGILLAPLMTPWVGFLLAIMTGSPRFLFETVMALLISAALIFVSGLMTGFASRVFPPMAFNNVYLHSRLWIPELVVIVIGAILLVASFVRSEAKPFLPSVVVAYTFFLPLSAAAFGIGAGLQDVWPQGALVSVVHLALATLFGLLSLFVLRLRPSLGGFIFTIITVLIILGTLALLMVPGFQSVAGASAVTPSPQPAPPSPTVSLVPLPTITASPKPTATPRLETAIPTEGVTPTPVPLTLDVTLPATETPTITLTVEATPVYGKIASGEGGGVNLRMTPNGKYLATLDNDSFVVVLPGVEDVNGVTWAHVIATKNGLRIEGWILESALLYATPVPDWQPTTTPTPGITNSP
jgi:hypothetical protein